MRDLVLGSSSLLLSPSGALYLLILFKNSCAQLSKFEECAQSLSNCPALQPVIASYLTEALDEEGRDPGRLFGFGGPVVKHPL